jgi:hypothetical protein
VVVGRCLNSNEDEQPLPIVIDKFYLNLGGWSVAGGGCGGTGEEVREVYAAVLLEKFSILKGQARRPSVLPVSLPYVGCILVALVLGECLKGHKSSKLQNGCIFLVFA